MKFKVGDLVTVKKELKGNNGYDGLWFAPEMEKFCGHTFIVNRITFDEDYVLKLIPEKKYPRGIRSDIHWWCFNDAMLEEPYVEQLSEFIRKEVLC